MGQVPVCPLPWHLGPLAGGALSQQGTWRGHCPPILLALCQRPCHCSGTALLLVFTCHHSQPDVLLQDSRHKLVALPCALGCGEVDGHPSYSPFREGINGSEGWHGWTPVGLRARAGERDLREAAHQPMLPHGNTSMGAFENPLFF